VAGWSLALLTGVVSRVVSKDQPSAWQSSVSEHKQRERDAGEGMGDDRGFLGDRHRHKMKSWVRQNCIGFLIRSKCCSTPPSRPLEIHPGFVIPCSGVRASCLDFHCQLSQVTAATCGSIRKRGLRDDTDRRNTSLFLFSFSKETRRDPTALGPMQPPLTALSVHGSCCP